MKSLLFSNSKHKKNIWFVFDKYYYYNNIKIKNEKEFPLNLYKNKIISYNYSSNIFVTCFKNRKLYGFYLSYYNKNGNWLFNTKTGNIIK